MASLLSPHRPGRPSGRQASDVRLTATKPTESEPQPKPTGPRYGWHLVAAGGALVAALAGWVIVAGLSVVGWLATAPSGAGDALAATLRTGTRLWMLSNGAAVQLGSVHWSLTPLGMSLLIAFMLSRFARAAARFAAPDAGDRGRVLTAVTGVTAAVYALAVAGVGVTTGIEVGRAVVGAVLIAGLGSLWGASRALELRLTDRLPSWAAPLPIAVAAAVGVLLLSGVAVLATGILLHADRIGSLAAGLGAGTVGGIALWAAQAAFLPNLVVWGTSYALGAGFAIGQGSVVAPSDVTLGLLPSFPILGALPGAGPGPDLALLWLLSGVAAGVVAALLVVRRRPAARFDESALVGGLAGVLAALIFTGLAWTTGGDLGDGRLAGAGPRLAELLVMSGTLLGLAGMISGLTFGLVRFVRSRRTAAEPAAAEPAAAEPTAAEPTAAEPTAVVPTAEDERVEDEPTGESGKEKPAEDTVAEDRVAEDRPSTPADSDAGATAEPDAELTVRVDDQRRSA